MGRKPTITRERLLDVAEEIVRSGGGGALTIAALAQAAGISKGGVQYSFATKDELVRSLINRWTSQFDAMLEGEAAESPRGFAECYIEATRVSQKAMNAKMAGLMVSYLEDPAYLSETRAWYSGVFERLAGDSPDAQAARVAFLAIEGLFSMRINGIDQDDTWTAFLDDVEAVLARL